MIESVIPQVTVDRNRPFAGFATNGGSSDKPSPKLWANIGYMKNGRFINLPLGSGIDTMEPSSVRGQNKEWVQLQTEKNEFLADLKAIGAKMAPGEERELFNVVVRLRRVNDDLVLTEQDTGPRLTQEERLALFTGAAKPTTEEAQSSPSKEELQAQLEKLQAALKSA